jgi:transglutaminase-like putative cysteine protease
MRAPVVAEWIEFSSWALVDQYPGAGVTRLTPAAAVDERLLAPTALTRADHRLRGVARELAATSSGLDLGERACAWAHDVLEYQWGVTGVHTTAADAVAGGVGVCQDYAHVMLAVCRAAGLPCRYVSGHLVGEGGSHAWVEVVVADTSAGGAGSAVAVPFDPTHNRRVGPDYFTVAVGRDYADVPPTSGTFLGDCPGVLSTSKRLGPAETRRFPRTAH